jgi:hypothetical protein
VLVSPEQQEFAQERIDAYLATIIIIIDRPLTRAAHHPRTDKNLLR